MSPSANVFGYAAPIWQRFRAPAHGGRLEGGDLVEAEAGSPATRSLLRVQIERGQGQLRRARFQAYGCPTAIAVGEWVAETLERQPPAQWAAIDAARIRAVLEIPEDKAHCALMGEDVLHALAQKMSGKE